MCISPLRLHRYLVAVEAGNHRFFAGIWRSMTIFRINLPGFAVHCRHDIRG
jgi:hypothetical protein